MCLITTMNRTLSKLTHPKMEFELNSCLIPTISYFTSPSGFFLFPSLTSVFQSGWWAKYGLLRRLFSLLSSLFVRGIRASSGTRNLKNATLSPHTIHVRQKKEQVCPEDGWHPVPAVHFHFVLTDLHWGFIMRNFRRRHKRQTAQTTIKCMSGAIQA